MDAADRAPTHTAGGSGLVPEGPEAPARPRGALVVSELRGRRVCVPLGRCSCPYLELFGMISGFPGTSTLERVTCSSARK